MALLTRVAVIVAMLAVPLALALASQVLAERPGPPDVDPQQVRLDIDVQNQAPTQPPSPDETPRMPTEPTTPSSDPDGTGTPAPSPAPGQDGGPRVVNPSVPGGGIDPDDGDGEDDDEEGEDD